MYAKITLDTSEYESGLEDAGGKGKNFAGTLKSGLATAGKAAAAGLAAASTAIIAIGKASIDSYGNYEQLVGGVETLFGESAQAIQDYADAAYQTAGMSANEYMETATSFAASLVQGLGGDTAAAADLANTAITDMSDNANKMGTDISSIQYAYQGFAKQNYTMLDNLKLGYGGTQAEMARLINDSGVLGDSMEVTAETVNQVSFDKIIEAIHTVQENMGIAGTTADEAATTIQGSFSSVKGAWSNLLTAFASDDMDVGMYVDRLAGTVTTAAGNILPRIQNILPNISQGITTLVSSLLPFISSSIQGLLPGLVEGAGALLNSLVAVLPPIIQAALDTLPELVSAAASVMGNLVNALIQVAPMLIQAGLQLLSQLATGIETGLPAMVARLPVIITSFLDYLTSNMPAILQEGVSIINSLVNGIVSAIPALVAALPQIITSFTGYIAQNLPLIIQAGFQILTNLITGIMNAIPNLIAVVPSLLGALVQAFADLSTTLFEVGNSIVQGIIDGIAAAWNGLVSWFNGLWDSLFGGRSVDVNVNANGGANGSHRAGLDYVPHNGYIAELHKGEAVLTRQEASDYRRGNPTPDSGVTVNQTIYAATQTPVELAAATKAYFQRARWALA